MTAGWYLRALLALAFVTTALHGLRPMVSYRALELGANVAEIGLVTASFGLLSFILAIPTGRWIDRLGEARFIVLGGVLMAVMSVAMFLSTSVLALGLAQIGLGAGNIMSLIGVQSLVANSGAGESRDSMFATLSVMGSIGQVIGPTMSGAIASASGGSTRLVFLVTGALFAAGALVGVWFWVKPAPSDREQAALGSANARLGPSMAKVFSTRSMPQAMLASVAVLTTIDLLVAYLPAYGEANGISVGAVSFLLSVRAAMSALSRIGMSRLVRKVGRHRLFVLCLAVPAVIMLSLPMTTSVPLLTVLLAVAGFGLGLGQPLSLSWIAATAPQELRGMALGVRLTGNRLGQVVVPAALGIVGGAAGVTMIFAMLAAMLGGAAGTLLTADFEPATPRHD